MHEPWVSALGGLPGGECSAVGILGATYVSDRLLSDSQSAKALLAPAGATSVLSVLVLYLQQRLTVQRQRRQLVAGTVSAKSQVLKATQAGMPKIKWPLVCAPGHSVGATALWLMRCGPQRECSHNPRYDNGKFACWHQSQARSDGSPRRPGCIVRRLHNRGVNGPPAWPCCQRPCMLQSELLYPLPVG